MIGFYGVFSTIYSTLPNSYSSGSSFHVGNNLRSDSLIECASKNSRIAHTIKPAIHPASVNVSIEQMNNKHTNDTAIT